MEKACSCQNPPPVTPRQHGVSMLEIANGAAVWRKHAREKKTLPPGAPRAWKGRVFERSGALSAVVMLYRRRMAHDVASSVFATPAA